MPKGKPKRGQFAFKVWFPEGGSLSVSSTRDQPAATWCDEIDRHLDTWKEMIARRRAQLAEDD